MLIKIGLVVNKTISSTAEWDVKQLKNWMKLCALNYT